MKQCSLPLNDPTQWPLRLTRGEVAHVTRRSLRTLHNRRAKRLFPQPNSDGMWSRDTVVRYLTGGIQAFDERHEREQRRKARAS